MPQSILTRRMLLGGLPLMALPGVWASALASAAEPGQPQAPEQAPQTFPEGVTLLVAGPDDGALDHWAAAIAPDLSHALANGAPIRRVTTGGADGVTGANQFDARSQPDGKAALLLPGSAALAWLVGDPRARFDIGRWLPILAGPAPLLLVGRPGLRGLEQDMPLRIAAAGPAGPDLPALLALDLLKTKAEPVFGLSRHDARAAYDAGKVDALLLRGIPPHAVLPPDSVALLRLDAHPAATGTAPAFVDLATSRGAAGNDLFEAWRAAATASALDIALVLPQLTPASSVALWRRAVAEAVASTAAQSIATDSALRLLDGPEASAEMAPLLAPVPVQIALRNWLATRFNWHPA